MVFSYIIEDMDGNVVEDFDYEIFTEERQDALEDILQNYSKEDLIGMVLDYCDPYDFYDELKEYFEDDARSWHNEQR